MYFHVLKPLRRRPEVSGEATEEHKMQLSDLRASEGKQSALGLREEQTDPL